MRRPTIIDEQRITPDLDASIRRGLVIAFPKDKEYYSQSRGWHGIYPLYSVCILRDGEAIAHAGVADRVIGVGVGTLRVAGVHNVYVLPEYRGCGLGESVMRESMAEARARGFDAGLLFCLPGLAKMYAAYGWERLPDRDITRTEDGIEKPLPGANLAMQFPIRLEHFPPGNIHLRGNDW